MPVHAHQVALEVLQVAFPSGVAGDENVVSHDDGAGKTLPRQFQLPLEVVLVAPRGGDLRVRAGRRAVGTAKAGPVGRGGYAAKAQGHQHGAPGAHNSHRLPLRTIKGSTSSALRRVTSPEETPQRR